MTERRKLELQLNQPTEIELLYDEPVYLFLGKGLLRALLAYIDGLDPGSCVLEEAGVGQEVVDYAVGFFYRFKALEGEEPRVSGASAHEIYFSCHKMKCPYTALIFIISPQD